jgi:enoyl-CoA hydratase
MFCGLTGARLQNGDAVELLDAQPIASDDIDKLIAWLASDDSLEKLNEFGATLRNGLSLANVDDWATQAVHLLASEEIREAFGQVSAESILHKLEVSGTEWGARHAATILTKSPTCTRIAFRQIREGAKLDFEDCMRLEYRLARFCMTQPDFYEGVRAVILDKDNAPKWNPATLAEADDAHVAPAFAPLGEEELAL